MKNFIANLKYLFNGKKPYVYLGNPILTQTCKPVTFPIDSVQQSLLFQFIEKSKFVLCHSWERDSIVGLAAPQVSVPLRAFAVSVENYNGEIYKSVSGVPNFKLYINPTVKHISSETQTLREGCVSVPGLEGNVTRYKHILLSYQDINGAFKTEEFKDKIANVIQHEVDHLDGILFTSKIEPQLK